MKSNIWKFTIHKTTITRMYMPILAVYLLTLPGTTSKTVGSVLLLASVCSFLFEVPSGYVSDKMGHKRALILARVALGLSTLSFLIGASLFWFVLGAILLSLGRAFISGTSAAFMHETLTELGRAKQYAKIMGKISSLSSAISIVFIAVIPVFVSISYQAAFVLPLILDLIGLCAVLSLTEPQKSRVEIEEISNKNFSGVIKEGYGLGIFPYLLLGAVIMSAITSTADFKEVYQAFLGIPVVYYGLFWAGSTLIISLCLLTNERVKTLFTFNQFIVLKLLFAIVLIGSLRFFVNPTIVVIIAILIAAFNWSFIETENGYLLDMMKSSHFKATLFSVKSLVYELLIGPAVYFIGLFALTESYQQAFFYNALALTALGTIFIFWILKKYFRYQTTKIS